MEREYAIPHNAKLLVENGQEIRAGDAITDGPINPQEYLETRGREAVQRYLVKEVQRVYRSQGVTINDKHIEIIVRQMMRKVRIDQPGDTEQLPFELIDRFEFEEINNKVLAEGGEPATAETVLLGVTKASLNTSSFLAAASFQETTRVLTEAAINGAKDRLVGLKENVIIGKLIPAGSGAPANVAARREAERRAAAEALAGGELPEGFGDDFNPFVEGSAPLEGGDEFEAVLGPPPSGSAGGGVRPEVEVNPFLEDLGDDDEDDEDDDVDVSAAARQRGLTVRPRCPPTSQSARGSPGPSDRGFVMLIARPCSGPCCGDVAGAPATRAGHAARPVGWRRARAVARLAGFDAHPLR